MRKSELLRVHGPDILSFVLCADDCSGSRRADGGMIENVHSIFIMHRLLGIKEKVCDVPGGFHRTRAAGMCPFFKNVSSWHIHTSFSKKFPKTCFDPSYDEDRMSALDSGLTDNEVRFVSAHYHSLARKNPMYPLWALSNPTDANQLEMAYESALETCVDLGLPEWFLEWPDKRQDINTFKFPWE